MSHEGSSHIKYTRAVMLKKLHLKKQLEVNPALSRYGREETS